jgi:hypothetical protein
MNSFDVVIIMVLAQGYVSAIVVHNLVSKQQLSKSIQLLEELS